MTAEPQRGRVSAHLVFGLIIIAVGVLFTLDNVGVLEAEDFLRYWPAGLILLGVAKLLEAKAHEESPIGGLLLAGIGTWILLDNIGVIQVRFIDFWPVVLVLVGCAIVWQGLRGRQIRPPGTTSDAVVNALAVLSGVSRGSNSTAFRGGELTAFMGGCEIDLRQAAIDGEAIIDVFAMWGGIDISVPEDWTVIGRVTPILGGFDDKTRAPKEATAHRLVIRGMVVMGGIEVKN